MEIIPAIDIRDGQCALVPGVDTQMKGFSSQDPLEQAIIFREMGSSWVHITDLDGAFSGRICNLRFVQEIAELPGMKTQYSGGVRSEEHVETLIAIGVSRVMLRASVLRDHKLTQKLFDRYGDKVIAGIDGRDGMVAIEGFETSVSTSVINMIDKLRAMGMKDIVYTDLRQSSLMRGPNIMAIEKIIADSGMNVFISGGVNSYDTINKLKDIGAAGLIIGKAIYAGAIDFRTAKQIARME